MRQLIAPPDATTWIAEEDSGQLAGFGNCRVERAGHGGVFAYIQTIEIAPQCRGRGIGSELMRRLEGSANAKGAVAIWLHVDETNAGAIRLYRSHGYISTQAAPRTITRAAAPAEIYIKHSSPLGYSSCVNKPRAS